MNYAIYETGKSNFTSSAFGPLRYPGSTESYPVNRRLFIWGDIGGGSVSLEIRMPDNTWETFPELTFTEKTAQDVKLFDEAVLRVVITGATSVNVLVTN